MAKANRPILIDGSFAGIATVKDRIPPNMLSNVKNMKINNSGGSVERLPGTRVLDPDDTIGFLDMFNMTISGVEIAVGVDYEKLRLYGFVASRPEKRLAIRTTSVVREFIDGAGAHTNQLAFTGGSRFKCVFSNGKYFIWSATTGEVLIIYGQGSIKIGASLEPSEQTTLNNMVVVPSNSQAIYVDAYIVGRMVKPDSYFTEIEGYFPIVPKLTMISEYGEGGVTGVLSDISYSDTTTHAGGVFSPFPAVSGDAVRKARLTNEGGGGDNAGYLLPLNGYAQGLTHVTAFPSGNEADGEIPYAMLLHLPYCTIVGGTPFPVSDPNIWYLIIPFDYAGTPVAGITSIDSATCSDYPIKVKTQVPPSSNFNYVAAITVKPDASKEDWLWITAQDSDISFTVNTSTGTPTVQCHVYRVLGPGTIDRPFPDALAFDPAVFVAQMFDATASSLSGADKYKGTAIATAIEVHDTTASTPHTSTVPTAGLAINDSFALTHQCVGIREERFKHTVEFIPSGGLLSSSSLAYSAIEHVNQEFTPPGLTADFYLNDSNGQVGYFMEHGYRIALSSYSELLRATTKRSFSFNNPTTGEVEYDAHGIDAAFRGSPQSLYPDTGILTKYIPPFISTKYINITAQSISDQNDMPIGMENTSDVAIVGQYAYATSNGVLLRGDSNTLTMTTSIDLGKPIKYLAQLADKVVVFFEKGLTAVAVSPDTGAMYERPVPGAELISANMVSESGGSILVVNNDGSVYIISPYTEEVNRAVSIRITNITSGVMDEGEFIDVVSIAHSGEYFYVATKTRVFMYDMILKAWAGIYVVETDQYIRAITTLSGDLVVYTLGVDVLPSDIYSSGGA